MNLVKNQMEALSNSIEFSVALWNVRSIKNGVTFNRMKSLFSGLISNKKAYLDCIVLTETWIENDTKFNFYELKNYNSVIRGRNQAIRGGGIAIYCKNSFIINEILCEFNINYEAVMVEIISGNNVKKVLAIYRPPSGSVNIFTEWLDQIVHDNSDLIIVGDMNLNLSNSISRSYVNMLMCHNYFVINSSCTRRESGTIIDHVIISDRCSLANNINVYTAEKSFLSDHNAIISLFYRETKTSKWNRTTIIRNDYLATKNELIKHIPLEEQSFNVNPFKKFDDFLLIVQQIMNKHRRELKVKHKSEIEIPPWTDVKINNYSRNINNIDSKIVKRKIRKLPYDKLQLKLESLKSALNSYETVRSRKYYTNLLANSKVTTWCLINELCGKHKKRNDLVIKSESEMITDGAKIAEVFNIKFQQHMSTNQILQKSLGPRLLNTMCVGEVDEGRIEWLLNGLSLKKAVGYDLIPAKLWKEMKSNISVTIANYINAMIYSEIYPNTLKVARIKPLHKGGDKTDSNNYRGISILPTINKVWERVIYDKIENYLEKYDLFDELQYGFRKGRGTQEAICKLMTLISTAINSRELAVVVFVDVSKAFDTVNHEVLLKKLEWIGMRGKINNILRNYLADRAQYVQIGEYKSEMLPISIGVPQGSNLGPLLFNILLYDMKYLNTQSTLIKFADDLAVFDSNANIDDLVNSINSTMEKLKHYYASNQLNLNNLKTKYMSFGDQKKVIELEIRMESLNIEKVDVIHYLGVKLDNKMSMNPHSDEITKKLTTTIRAMRILRNYLPQQSIYQFYNAHFSSHLSYCAFVLMNLSQESLNSIQTLQNKALKLTFGLDWRCPTIELFTIYAKDILPVTGSIIYSILVLTKRCLTADDNYLHKFELNDAGRREGHIKIPRFKSKSFENSITCAGAKLFNQLPPQIRNVENIKEFKLCVKKYLLERVEFLLDSRIIRTKIIS